MRVGVESVWASPEQGLVVVHGTAEAWAVSLRIRHKLKTYAEVVSDGSAPYYGPPEPYGYGAPPQQHEYYSRQHHGYYSHPPPQPGYPYAAGGYDGWAADPDPYGYAAYNTVPACSIM
jgi:hypothetical protein